MVADVRLENVTTSRQTEIGGYGTKTPTCFLTVATGKRMRFVEELLRRKCCNSLIDDQQANVRIEPTALCPAIRPQSQSSQ